MHLTFKLQIGFYCFFTDYGCWKNGYNTNDYSSISVMPKCSEVVRIIQNSITDNVIIRAMDSNVATI